MLRLARVPLLRRSYQPIPPSVPRPTYDTGCTFCQPLLNDLPISDQPLAGTRSAAWKHVMVFTRKPPGTWPGRLELTLGTGVMEALAMLRDRFSPAHPIMISYVFEDGSEPLGPGEHETGATVVEVYPDRTRFEISPEQVPRLVREHLVPHGYVKQEVYNPFKPKARKTAKSVLGPVVEPADTSPELEPQPVHTSLAVVCGHTNRDHRCGVLAPAVLNELRLVLAREEIADWRIGTCSHLGGHVYAGILVLFDQRFPRGSTWYGRVEPQMIQGIVRESIQAGRVLQDITRD